jgi:hypothetical protein
MCEVCDIENIDTFKKNGSLETKTTKLYSVLVDEIMTVELCKLHILQLFICGESRFLEKNPTFSRVLQIHNKMFYKTILEIVQR